MKKPLRFKTTTIILLAVLSGIGCTPRNVIKPFTTDQCSGSAEGPKEDPNAWCECCLKHDKAYWQGGARALRRRADRALKQCVAKRGYERRSRLMYVAVRLFGSPFLPFSWRWGYGWRYFHPYRELKAEEADSVRTVFSREESMRNFENGCSE